MRRSPSETWMFSVVFWILCSWLPCLADWQVSCSRFVVQLQQNICHQNDIEHEWQSIFSPKRTRRSEQNFLRRDEYRRPGSRYFAWQHLVYQAGNLEFNSSSDRQPMKLTQYRCDVLSDVSLLDNHSTYGMTANPLLSCADLFLFFVSIVFFLFWHWSCFTLSKIHFG